MRWIKWRCHKLWKRNATLILQLQAELVTTVGEKHVLCVVDDKALGDLYAVNELVYILSFLNFKWGISAMLQSNIFIKSTGWAQQSLQIFGLLFSAFQLILRTCKIACWPVLKYQLCFYLLTITNRMKWIDTI
jgi:hypothetical protein